jgi:acyl-CoA synthetase (AMP-forming)/AMP-acid ligase II
VLTHRNLLTTIDAINGGIGGATAQDSSLSWMPLTHDMGLIGFHLVPVRVCASHWLMTPSQFVRRPLSWLQKTAEHGVSVTCSPNFGYKHLLKSFDPALCAGLDLSCVRVVINGAEPISAELCREFLAAFGPFGLRQDVMLPVYGLAEASLAVTFPPLRRALATVMLARDAIGPGDTVQRVAPGRPDGIEYVKVGTPVAGCELRIANSEGDAEAAGGVGRILIRGDNVTRGYYADAELTAATITPDGWLDTGDLGAEVDGELVVTGRTKDVVFIAGSNHYPHDLEALLAKHAGIETGRAAVVGVRAGDGVSDDLVVFVVHKGDLATFLPTHHIVQRVLGEHAGIAVQTTLPVRQIPKTTSGKLQRYLLAQELATGTYAQTAAELTALRVATSPDDRTGNAIENRLLEICQAMIPGRRLSPDDNLFEAGTSSLTLAQIYERVDNAYPGMLEVTDFFDYPTVRAMAHYLDRRIAAAT